MSPLLRNNSFVHHNFTTKDIIVLVVIYHKEDASGGYFDVCDHYFVGKTIIDGTDAHLLWRIIRNGGVLDAYGGITSTPDFTLDTSRA